MFRFITLFALFTCIVGDWSLNPFQWERGITPDRDYSTALSPFDRWKSQMDPFPSLAQLTSSLPMDIRESKEFIDIQMDLPGVEKKDISITIHRNNEVNVSAEKKGITKAEDPCMKRVERFSGKVSRTILFPSYVDLEKLDAKYIDGVLYLRTPKLSSGAEDMPRSILIK
jgi:HSP20 family protein